MQRECRKWGALTGAAREEVVRTVRKITAKEKKRMVGLAWRARGYLGEAFILSQP